MLERGLAVEMLEMAVFLSFRVFASCVSKISNCAVEILRLVLNDLCAEQLRDELEFVFSPDIISRD